ncbi:RNA polymerase sigma factor [Novosphingobium sp.]|uniref:RNA polymerase sigma factor n=1 Tax=Novosphingobium sp. TaxID=1874826 RepID=UPI002FE3CFB5
MIERPDNRPAGGSSEEDLDCAAGDVEPEALQRTLITIYRELSAGLERTWGSREAALDALQDTSAKLAAGARIGAVHNPRAYLRRMAFNLGQNRRRALARSVPVDPAILEAAADEAPDPERMTVAADELARVFHAARELPEQRRVIFFHRWADDLSTGEIAGKLGIRRRTVQKELARAAKVLRARLDGDDKPFG